MAISSDLSSSIRSVNRVPFDDKGQEEDIPQAVAPVGSYPVMRISDLPTELIVEIFRRVVRFGAGEDEKATCSIRHVCRLWNILADDFLLREYWNRLKVCPSPSMQEFVFEADEKIQELEDRERYITGRNIERLPYFSRFCCLRKEITRAWNNQLLHQQEELQVLCPYLGTNASILGFHHSLYLSVGERLDQLFKAELWSKIWKRLSLVNAHPMGHIQSVGERWLNNHMDQVRRVTEIDLSNSFKNTYFWDDDNQRIFLRVVLSELERFTELKELDLSFNKDLTGISPTIGRFTGLHRLFLHHTPITSIPDEVGNLVQLTELVLDSNQLKKIPDSIGQLNQLTMLVLSQNQLETIPQSMGMLTQLKELYLYDNRLRRIPETFAGLAQLEILCLQGNRLRQFPQVLENLSHLKVLNLSHNHIEFFSQGIHRLQELGELDMSHNSLKGVPRSIGALTQLTRLDLSHNGWFLKRVPQEIGRLFQLIELDLSHNTLEAIPSSMGDLKSLASLSLNHNRLQVIPSTIGQLSSLVRLALNNNHLRELPEMIGDLTGLYQLDLSSNHLDRIPQSMSRLVHLEELDLSDNWLTRIPREIHQMPSLRRLRFFNNPLNNISDMRRNVSNKIEDVMNSFLS